MLSKPLLKVEKLTVRLKDGGVPLLDRVSLTLNEGAALGLVGGSGAGKSTLAMAILGLLSNNMVVTGKIEFLGNELNTVKDWQTARGKMAIIFQDAATALNPVFSIGTQVADIVAARGRLKRREARQMAVELLDRVGFSHSRSSMKLYPHQLSGGMKQRVLVAMALAGRPRLLIADEPTTALDVCLQEQIIGLIQEYQVETGCGLLFISHDLAVTGEVTERLAVMDNGRIIEAGITAAIFAGPKHLLTKRLLDSVLSLETAKKARYTRQAAARAAEMLKDGAPHA